MTVKLFYLKTSIEEVFFFCAISLPLPQFTSDFHRNVTTVLLEVVSHISREFSSLFREDCSGIEESDNTIKTGGGF